MPLSYPQKKRYTIDDLAAILALLRSPDGCPWDRVQTHESIRSNLLEEAYEALEAIACHDTEHLKEELGDVLLQVVFHAQMESEVGTFTLDDVVDGVCRKMLTRHPHVFGDVVAADSSEALKTWDAVKRQTGGDKKQADLLTSVPRALPALMRTEKVQGRAIRGGYDFGDVSRVLADLAAAATAVGQAATEETPDPKAMGRLLFTAVTLCRAVGWDAEQALTDHTDAFVSDFRRWETADN